MQKYVYCFQNTDELSKPLKVIHEKKLSKFPIYEGKAYQGLLTQKGITNWLASMEQHEEKLKSSYQIKDVLPFENEENSRFIAEDTAIYEAVDLFKELTSIGRRLEALLITTWESFRKITGNYYSMGYS
ncbi:hypothetical protein [Virgibacillus proomii]|uniref:hypothetical protein n=1 Tax=Virgibacillus proomii TaxID=84407 RepID=UPI00209E9472|nr:hypothetical protein [Virgibacillus proomii]